MAEEKALLEGDPMGVHSAAEVGELWELEEEGEDCGDIGKEGRAGVAI